MPMLRSLTCFFLTCVAWPFFAFADKLIYSGTFDPFTIGHYDEAVAGFKHFKKTAKNPTMIIAPIEEAYYALSESGYYYPKLFSFDLRSQLIQKSFVGQKDVVVTQSMKRIDANVFEEMISRIPDKVADEKITFLVGTDVLDIWHRLPGFESFKNKVNLIVSIDPTDPEGTAKLTSMFKGDPRVQIVDFKVTGVRAADVKKNLIFDLVATRKQLPSSTYAHLEEHPEALTKMFSEHEPRLRQFAIDETIDILRKHAKQGSVSSQFVNSVSKCPRCIEAYLEKDLFSFELALKSQTIAYTPQDMKSMELMSSSFSKNRKTISLAASEKQYLTQKCLITSAGNLFLSGNL